MNNALLIYHKNLILLKSKLNIVLIALKIIYGTCSATECPNKIALITGISGQDGTYLAAFLLEKGYQVHGLARQNRPQIKKAIFSLCNQQMIDENNLFIHEGDIADSSRIFSLIQRICPDEIYNLAAESRVGISFEKPTGVSLINALGPLHILEAIRILGLGEKVRMFQASSSEIFGTNNEVGSDFFKCFHPCSPYAVSKLFSHLIMVVYREAYGFFAVNGICYNHESPLRGDSFVTKKISQHVALKKIEKIGVLKMGNLNSCRDWGHARDYVEGMWLMLQQNTPHDYILATGKGHTVREFVEHAFLIIGKKIEWSGHGADEKGYDSITRELLVEVDKKLFRPLDVAYATVDPIQTFISLNWKPKTNFFQIIEEMVRNEIQELVK